MKTFDYADKSQDGFFATAFFADCEHELKPVTKGFRLALIYNLIMKQEGQDDQAQSQLPSADFLTGEMIKLQKLGWKSANICHRYVMKHKYTPTNLSLANMKGRDRLVVDLLRSVQDENGHPLYSLSLVLLTRHQSGQAAFDHFRRYDDSEDEKGSHVMEEVYEDSTNIDYWIGPDGTKIRNWKNLSIFENSLLIDGDMDDMFDENESPDEEEYEGYTGNEGPTLDYWYYRSAVIFCPMSNAIKLTKELGFSAAISILLQASCDFSSTEVKEDLARTAVDLFKSNPGHYISNEAIKSLLSTLGKVGSVSSILDVTYQRRPISQ